MKKLPNLGQLKQFGNSRQPRNQPNLSNIEDAAQALPYLLGIPIKDFTVIASGDNKT